VAYPFVNAGSQHFRVFLNLDEEVIISVDPDIAYEENDFKSVDEHSSLLELDKSCIIFNNLLTQTFEAACQANYEKQQVRRTYADTLETDDFTLFGYGEEDIDGHRRELVWKPQDEVYLSLEGIYFEFKAFLDNLPPSSKPALHRLRGRYTIGTVHRCPGYNRAEITLSPSIARSAIVSHSTPLPNEICPVCNRVVQDVEIFDCICGAEDDESKPTIQCSKCRKWHHRHCVLVGSESTTRSFTCPNCQYFKTLPGIDCP